MGSDLFYRVQTNLSLTYFTHPDFASLVDPLYDKS
jgi:hypothetical protein